MTNNKDFNGKVVKSRYWAMIAYPENMLPEWPSLIADVVQVPYVYCVHDQDHLSGRLSENGEDKRKIHVHIGLVFPGPTTFESAKRVVDLLALPGKTCCPVGEPIINWAYYYKYLIHDTPGALAIGKHLYQKKERIEGNNFDIDLYYVVSESEKKRIRRELANVISAMGFSNYFDFYMYVNSLASTVDDGELLMDVAESYHQFFANLCKGIYLKYGSAGLNTAGKK